MEQAVNGGFSYSYSAKANEEIEALKSKYEPYSAKDTTLVEMKQLDEMAESAARKRPIEIGIIGLLLLTFGMIATLVLGGTVVFWLGVVIGAAGIVLASISYPLYAKNVKAERERIAAQMIELAEKAGR